MGLMSSKYSQGPEMIRTSVHYKHYGGFLGRRVTLPLR